MASYLTFQFFILCLFGVVSSQLVTLGGCPEVKVQENFDLNRYLGKWYENRRYTNWFSLFSRCVTAEYSKITETSVKVNNTGWLYLDKKPDTAIGNAVQFDGAKLGVRFSEFSPYGAYWVLETDYTSYSIVWSCDETPDFPIQFNSQYLWILTRSPDGVPDIELKRIMGLLKGYGINTELRKLKPTKHSDCFGQSTQM